MQYGTYEIHSKLMQSAQKNRERGFLSMPVPMKPRVMSIFVNGIFPLLLKHPCL